MSNRPSTTALRVLRGVLSIADREPYRALLPDGWAAAARAVLRGAGKLPGWIERFYGSSAYRGMLAMSERARPGVVLHLVLRKRAVHDLVVEAVEAGAEQLLVVGAGYDVLGVLLGERGPAGAAVRVVEVDQPATQALKRRGLEASGGVREGYVLVPADLSEQGLPEVLDAVEAWDPGARSAVVAEGLLMYLSEAAVAGFFAAVRSRVAAGSRLVFTYVPGEPGGGRPSLMWLVRGAVALVGEPMRWFPVPGTLEGLLAEHGWALGGPEARDLKAYLAERPAHHFEGERLAVARAV